MEFVINESKFQEKFQMVKIQILESENIIL